MTRRLPRRALFVALASLPAACSGPDARDEAPAEAGSAALPEPALAEPTRAEPEPQAPRAALDAEPLLHPADLAQRLTRDRRLSFPASAAERARRELEGGLPEPAERGVALITLGAAGSLPDRARIEASATDGPAVEREAAILALGELGARGAAALARLSAAGVEQDEEEEAEGGAAPAALPLESALRLALLRARGEGSPEALAGWGDEAAVTRLLDLRWKAAERYGLVDGLRWQTWRTEQLLEDQVFLLRTVLGAAPLLEHARAADHVLQILLENQALERIAPVVAFMPEEVADLVTTGRWLPAGPEEWSALLRTLREEHLERRMVDLLLFAAGAADLREEVTPLLVRAGEPAPEDWVTAQLQSPDPPQVVVLVEALAEGGHVERISDVWPLVTRSDDVDVAAAALVCMARLGDATSSKALEDRLASAEGEARDATIRAVARAAHDPRMRAVVTKLVARGEVGEDLAHEVDLALARTGTPRDLDVVRGWLAPSFSAEVRRSAIRSLSERASQEDLARLRELFPLEDDEAGLNVELAVALIRHRDPLALSLLRRVLWEGSWNLSLLAGGLMLGDGGPHSLQDELEAPPESASQRDRRRVGFALGLWGGMQVVENLAQRRSESDPVLQGAYLGVLSTSAAEAAQIEAVDATRER